MSLIWIAAWPYAATPALDWNEEKTRSKYQPERRQTIDLFAPVSQSRGENIFRETSKASCFFLENSFQFLLVCLGLGLGRYAMLKAAGEVAPLTRNWTNSIVQALHENFVN
jgi:hypothetical protein